MGKSAQPLKRSFKAKFSRGYASLVIVMALCLYSLYKLQDTFQEVLLDVSKPMWQVASYPFEVLKPFIQSVKTFQNHQILVESHQELSRSHERLSHHLKALELEARQLKRDLKVEETTSYGRVQAKVCALLKTADQCTLVLDQGSKKGIKKNSFVVAQGALVGLVSEVSSYTCKVKTLSDPAFKVSVTNAKTADRLIIGSSQKEDGQLTIIHQEHHKPNGLFFKEGDVFLTTGLMAQHVKGLAVATIDKIEDQKIFLKPCVDPKTVDYVSVVEPLDF